ncbi:mediator complex protein-domain-containing protein [Coniella lustricola]|uniref:Mediator of RNA polymerase II transcription subunit 11 n=1 Tax=Coniella lustricola TaxID=2025994 RepID=A0A2T3AJN3_9PEZI|nr:mediator complex protein-domain-containing protein [Coniella lustricola]
MPNYLLTILSTFELPHCHDKIVGEQSHLVLLRNVMMESSSPDGTAPVDIHAPFTRAERMVQLAEIDQDIASLLELSGKAIQSLGKQASTEPDKPASTAQDQTQAFQDNMDKFLNTLHAVDVRLKRQIFGLEEAGILTLDKLKVKDEDGSARPSLEPNGLGMVGNLDVGWLNSRSNQVETEMEAELWTKTRQHLGAVAGRSDADGNAKDEDVKMTG